MKTTFQNSNAPLMQTVDHLERARVNLRIIYSIYGSIYLVTLALYFVNAQAMVTLFLINTLAGILIIGTRKRAYNRDLLHANILWGLSEDIADINHTRRGVFTHQQLTERGLVPPYPKGFISREGVTGTLGGMPVALSDITTPFQKCAGTGQKTGWFSGCMVSVQLPKDTALDMRIVDLHFFPYSEPASFFGGQNGLAALNLPEGEFQKSFAVYTAQPIELPNGLVKRLIDLRSYTPGTLGIAIQGNVLTVIIRQRFLAISDTRLKAPVTQAVLSYNPFPEIKKIQEIASYMAHFENPLR